MKKFFLSFLCSICSFLTFAQWTVTNFNTATDVSSIKFNGASEVWLACDTGVFLSLNNGSSFTQHGLYYPGGNIYIGSYMNDVAVINSTTAIGAGLFYLGNDEMIIRTTNSAANWDTVEHLMGTFLAQFACADFPTASTGYVAGWQGRIFRSTNGGLSFSTVYTNPSISWEDCKFTSANEGVVVGEGGIVYTSNGTAFTQVLNLPGSLFNSVSFSGSTGYAGGSSASGNLYKSTDDGATWTAVNFPFSEIKGVHAISADTVVAVTLNMAYKTTNGGQYWEEFVLPVLPAGNHQFKDIGFRGPEGYIACSDGVLLRTGNGGGVTKPIADFTDSASYHCQNVTYAFTNNSPANYSYEWYLDGALISTSYNLVINLPDSGSHTLQMVADNGALTDTASVNLFVNAVNFITPLFFHADTVCPGGASTISVFNSAPGTLYRLRNGFANIGSQQFGNGGTLTFTTPTLQVNTTYNILNYGSNSCYTDSLVTPLTVIAFPDITVPVIKGDTMLCSGTEPYQLNIDNTQPGVIYKLKFIGVTLDSLQGNGGTITLHAGVFYGTNSNKNLTLFAWVNSSCSPQLPVIHLHVDTVIPRFEVSNPGVFPGDTINLTNQSYADGYLWTFPPQASIQSSILASPKFTIGTPGAYPVELKVTNTEGCADSVTKTVYVGTTVPAGTNNFCGNGTGLDPSSAVYDSYLDQDKNLYVTGANRKAQFGNYNMFYVSKFDSLGQVAWYRTVFNYSFEKSAGQGIAVDKAGNVYVAGYHEGTKITFDTIDVAGAGLRKGFLAKYNSNGDIQWVVKATAPSSSPLATLWISDVKIDSLQNLYVTGEHHNGVFTFPDGSTFAATGDSVSAFIMTLDTNGIKTSYASFGATSGGHTTPSNYVSNPRLYPVKNGDMLVSSCFSDSSNNLQTSFGPYSFTDTSNVIFFGFFNKNTGWKNVHRSLSGNISFLRKAIADDNMHIYLTGMMRKQVSFLNTSYNLEYDVNGNYFDYNFIARIDSSGNNGWLNYSRLSKITDITFNSSDELIFCAHAGNKGMFSSQTDPPAGILSNGNDDFVIGKYDASGNVVLADHKGSSLNDMPYSINLDDCDNVYLGVGRYRISQYWPDAFIPNNFGASFAAEHYSKDSFCYHDATCSGSSSDTLDDDGAVISTWVPELSGFTNVPVRAQIKSLGNDTLFNAQIVVEVNGVQQLSYNWNDTLIKYQLLDSVDLGQVLLATAGTYQIKTYITSPNGNVDLNHDNDTAYTTIEVCAPLAGAYTIGNGGNFATFSEATKHLTTCGIGGHVVFNVLPGVYTDRIILKDIPSSVIDSVIFQSANHDSISVILQWGGGYPFSNALVEINNMDYLTLNQMTIRNLDYDPSVGMNIRTTNGCEHMNILNCVIERYNPDTVVDGDLFTQSNSPDHYLTIRNNLFFQGGEAITMWGSQTNSLIENNRFINQTEGGIRCQGVIGPVVRGNYIETNYHRMNAFFGIAMTVGTTDFLVSGNTVISDMGDVHAFAVGTNCTVTDPGIFCNNMFSSKHAKEFSIGLQYGNCSNIKFLNNSIYIDGPAHTNAAISSSSTVNTNVEIANNIFYMADSGYIMWVYDFLLTTVTINNNCYYTKNTNIIRDDTLGGNYPQYFQTLPQWTAVSGQDAFSFIHAPLYISTTDLHILNDTAIDNKGLPSVYVTDDFDGDLRSPVTPDLGCDEFTGNPNAVNVWPGDADNNQVVDNYDIIPLGFYMNNTGNARSTVSNVYAPQQAIKWAVNQYNGQDKVYADCDGNGTIQYADTIAVRQNYGLTHLFQNANQKKGPYPLITSITGPDIYFVTTDSVFIPGDTVSIEVWTGTAAQPVTGLNGIGFQMNINPSIIEPSTYTCDVSSNWMCGISNCITFSNADDVTGNADGTIVKTDGIPVNGYGKIATVAFIVNSSAPPMNVQQLDLLNYFALDSLGDSIVFNIIVDSISVGTSTGITVHEQNGMTLYPNPVNDELHIGLTEPTKEGIINILDLSGRIVESKTLMAGQQNIRINTTGLVPGYYFVELRSNQSIRRLRFVKS